MENGMPLRSKTMAAALNMGVWGGIFCLADINFVTNGWNIDVFPDALGYLMILIALGTLARARLGDGYAVRLAFATVVVSCSFVVSLLEFRKPAFTPQLWGVITGVRFLFEAVAAIGFCTAMMSLALAAGADGARQSFRVSRVGIIVLYLSPYLIWLAVFGLSGRGMHFEFSLSADHLWLVIAAGVLLFLPMLHLAISMHMLRATLAEDPEPATVSRLWMH